MVMFCVVGVYFPLIPFTGTSSGAGAVMTRNAHDHNHPLKNVICLFYSWWKEAQRSDINLPMIFFKVKSKEFEANGTPKAVLFRYFIILSIQGIIYTI